MDINNTFGKNYCRICFRVNKKILEGICDEDKENFYLITNVHVSFIIKNTNKAY